MARGPTYRGLCERVALHGPATAIGASAEYPYDEGLAEALTVTTRTDHVLNLAHATPDGSKLLVPRACCRSAQLDRRSVGARLSLRSGVHPRSDEQAEMMRATRLLLSRGESFLLEAGTGTGKTVMAIDALAATGRKALVIVPKGDLMDQWESELRAHLPGVRVGTIRQKKYDVVDKDVVIGMLHSLSRPEKYPASLCDEWGLVVWDEVHRVPADTFSSTASLFSARLRLGLSATPRRWDGKEILVEANIGPVAVRGMAVRLSPVVGLHATKWRVPLVYRKGRLVPAPHSPGKCGHLVSAMVEDNERNALVLARVLAAFKAGRRTVVFSDRVAHLERLRVQATRHGVPWADSGLYARGVKRVEMKEALHRRLVFATYGMMAEGTDAPWLDCCVLATPRKDVTQPVGRILREHPGKPQPVVVDFSDSASAVFHGYTAARLRWYRSIGARVHLR